MVIAIYSKQNVSCYMHIALIYYDLTWQSYFVFQPLSYPLSPMGTLEPHDGSTRNLNPSLEQQSNIFPEALATLLPALMHTENSGENELQVVQEELEKLENKFGDLVLDAQEVFSKKEKTSTAFLPKLRNSLVLPSSKRMKRLRFLKESRKEIRKATSVEDFFYVLNFYWNCLNYSLLEYLIGKFGNEALKTRLNRYLADLQKFEKSTKVKDFVNTYRFNYKLPPSSEVIAVKMKVKWADYTLDHVRELGQELVEAACLEEFTLFFSGGAISSIILMWAVPSSVGHLLAEAMDESFLEKHEIERVTIAGKGLHDYLLMKSIQQPVVKQCPVSATTWYLVCVGLYWLTEQLHSKPSWIAWSKAE